MKYCFFVIFDRLKQFSVSHWNNEPIFVGNHLRVDLALGITCHNVSIYEFYDNKKTLFVVDVLMEVDFV